MTRTLWAIESSWTCLEKKGMDTLVIKIFESSTKSPWSTPSWAQILYTSLFTPLLHLTCGAGPVAYKDLTVSSDQGNA